MKIVPLLLCIIFQGPRNNTKTKLFKLRSVLFVIQAKMSWYYLWSNKHVEKRGFGKSIDGNFLWTSRKYMNKKKFFRFTRTNNNYFFLCEFNTTWKKLLFFYVIVIIIYIILLMIYWSNKQGDEKEWTTNSCPEPPPTKAVRIRYVWFGLGG